MTPSPGETKFALQWLVVCTVCVGLILVSWLTQQNLESTDLFREKQSQQNDVLREAEAIRFRLEAEALSTLYLFTSLGSHIYSNPDISEEEFSQFSKTIFDAKPGLVNIAAAPDMVIRFIYPKKGNESAIGLNYKTHAKQRAAAMMVKELGKPVIAGPVDLVQGGSAFIARFPVYAEINGKVEFWGIISTPLETTKLYERAGLLDPKLSIEIALRGKDGKGADGETFFGESDLFEEESLRLAVTLITGKWQMGIRPKMGWISEAPNKVSIRWIVWFICLLTIVIAVLMHLYILNIQKRRVVELSVSKAKSRLLANMSHEIRTPLNGICGVAQILQSSNLDEEQMGLANVIVSSSKSLSELLQDVLNLSRLELGKYNVKKEPFELDQCINSVLKVVESLVLKKDVIIEYIELPRSGNRILADEAIIRQVLWNLLSNAVKFTSKGTVKLEVEIKSISGSSQHNLIIVVSDTGVGIPRKFHKTVFEDFVQVDESETRNYGGAGLGLAIVKRLVDHSGGSIRLESEKGKGSRFTVETPVELIVS